MPVEAASAPMLRGSELFRVCSCGHWQTPGEAGGTRVAAATNSHPPIVISDIINLGSCTCQRVVPSGSSVTVIPHCHTLSHALGRWSQKEARSRQGRRGPTQESQSTRPCTPDIRDSINFIAPTHPTMPQKLKKHDLSFPIFAVAFGPKKARLIVAGGGGATRAGIKNTLVGGPTRRWRFSSHSHALY